MNYLIRHWLIITSPFPFLKLPGEIRNEIYKYVAASNNKARRRCPIKWSAKQPDDHSVNIYLGNRQNQACTTLPGLFLVCSQVYHESRVLFHRHHDFRLYIWQGEKGLLSHLKAWFGMKNHGECMERIFTWLDIIRKDMRKEIRTLKIELQCHEAVSVDEYLCFMDDLHARLSDRATVIYRPMAASPMTGVTALWKLGKAFYDRDHMRIPRFEYLAWAVPFNQAVLRYSTIWACSSVPLVKAPKRRAVGVPSLIFGPGAGWFGGKGCVSESRVRLFFE